MTDDLTPAEQAEARLPEADPGRPCCGACRDELDHNDYGWYCEPCRLFYDGQELTPEYLDPDTSPCGHECTSKWHQFSDFATQRFTCATCALPKGHTSPHWTDCTINQETT